MTRATIQLETDEPILVIVVPLSPRASVTPPRKCGPKRIVETTGTEVADVIPFARTLRKVG